MLIFSYVGGRPCSQYYHKFDSVAKDFVDTINTASDMDK